MLNRWIIITEIGTLLGIIIGIKSLIMIRNVKKKLNAMKDDDVVPENIKSDILKSMKLMIIGITLTTVSGIIRIFLR